MNQSNGQTSRRIVYICDWLPPDFGAVGQYSLHFARELAQDGNQVLLVGLSSKKSSVESEHFVAGRLTICRLRAESYDRSRFLKRMLWTLRTNLKLIWILRRELRTADEVLFTGSPPFLLHFLAPLNELFRRKLVYRITDFHPECLMASLEATSLSLRAFYRLTLFWRRRVNTFEVLGEDQRRRLMEIGIKPEKIKLKRDLSPVHIPMGLEPLERPPELQGRAVLLYSGNFGVAHDDETFIEGYALHHRSGSGRVGLWLNATGAKADHVEKRIREAGLPVYRSYPVPLDELPRLLISADAHLITLRDAFVGFVLPSKVYGCIDSKKDVLYVGSSDSDIYWLSKEGLGPGAFHHAIVGDSRAVAESLERIADRSTGVRKVPRTELSEELASTESPAVD